MTQGGRPCWGTTGNVPNLFMLREGQAQTIIWSFLFCVNCSVLQPPILLCAGSSGPWEWDSVLAPFTGFEFGSPPSRADSNGPSLQLGALALRQGSASVDQVPATVPDRLPPTLCQQLVHPVEVARSVRMHHCAAVENRCGCYKLLLAEKHED